MDPQDRACSRGLDETDARELAELAVRGGWPEAIGLSAGDAQEVAREHLRLFRTVTASGQGKDPELMRRMLLSLARIAGQVVCSLWRPCSSTAVRYLYRALNDGLVKQGPPEGILW